jgi:hypothetical protein
MAPVWVAILACLVFSLAAECGTATTTTLVPTPNPSVYGQQVTLTAAVTPSAATGSVTFYDGASPLDSRNLSGGVAVLQTSALAVGDHNLTAKYNGDGTYDSSTSDPVTQTVDKADTTVSVTSSVNPSVTGQSVTFTATVAAVSPGSGTPPGTVDFYVNGELSASNVTLTAGHATHSRSFDHIEGPADIAAYYDGNANYNPSDNGLNPLTQTVNKATTTTTITTAPVGPVTLGGGFSVSGTVAATAPGAGTPTGTVVVSTGSGDSCAANLSGGAWSCSLTSSAVGTTNLTAVYEGDESFAGSSGAAATTFETTAIGATITVFVSDTPLVPGETATGTVSVQGATGNFGAAPTGTVTLTLTTGNGTLTNTPYVLTEADGGYFEFTYTPTDAAITPHVITASYGGGGVYAAGSDTFDQAIEKREADIEMNITPTAVYVMQPVTVTFRIEDDTTAGTHGDFTNETVSLSSSSSTGWFAGCDPGEDKVVDLGGPGDYTVTYTPGAMDDDTTTTTTTTITATLAESSVYATTAANQAIVVSLRPTQTTISFAVDDGVYVYEETTFTVTVADTAGDASDSVAPEGDITIRDEATTYGGVREVGAPMAGEIHDYSNSWDFSYMWTELYAEGVDYDVVTARYDPSDRIHRWSEGSYGISVSRRPTVISVECVSDSATDLDTPFTAEVTVTEVEDLDGEVRPVEGNLTLLNEDQDFDWTPPGPVEISVPSNGLPMVMPSVQYNPSDNVHISTVGSPALPCMREIDTSGGGDGTTGANCGDGCGDGGVDVTAVMLAMNDAGVTLHSISLGLDTAAIVVSLIPDPVWAAGIVFSSGTEIPLKEIIAAIIDGSKVLIDTALLIMETDLDGDGIPDVVEQTVTGKDWPGPGVAYRMWDTDADGLGDLDEIQNAGGFYGGTRRPDPNVWDSDGDGLGDGDEAQIYNTNFCVADTDCDTATDGAEVGTWSLSDIRDHADPLIQDTDGDGLRDDRELAEGCPYVNDDDSDDDGLQDGAESWDGNGTCNTGTIGDSLTQSSLTGETDFCNPDTDGDGLTDGEEVALLGGLPVTGTGFTPVTPKGVSAEFGVNGLPLTATIPALDDDSDNDGLSDYEEVTITHTDPLDQDSDNDTLSDANELIAVAGPGSSWPHRSFIQISDPLDPDSDDDGLPDQVEYPGGSGLGIQRSAGGVADNVCSYVNDDDSDDDGLQDGYEDLDKNGQFDLGTIGGTGTAGSGETDLCNPDTDGDGLLDGEEEGLLGQGSVFVTSQDGIAMTVPALDTDSDDDGLSDYEEANVTHTDPLDWDTDNDTLSDLNELLVTGGTWPQRTFSQISDPLDPDTDDDGLLDNVEYEGTGSDRFLHKSTDGRDDLVCPYVNDADSDDDGLQDGVEDADHDGNWDEVTLGSFDTQAQKTGDYWECDACNPDTDGDGLLDGEEVTLLGGGPVIGRPSDWPNAQPMPGFDTVTPEERSTQLPMGTVGGLAGSPPGTGNSWLGPYTFVPVAGSGYAATVPALDSDSDNDGLSDYEEVNTTHTSPLDQDTDNDTLMDGDELIATGGAWPSRTFDQESDPLDVNTDDDHLFDPQEYAGSGLSTLNGIVGGQRDSACPYVNDDDSDNDGIQDGAVVVIDPAVTVTGMGVAYDYGYTHYEDFVDLDGSSLPFPGMACSNVGDFNGEQRNDDLWNVCDPDSDGDGLNDGEEVAIGTNPDDCDTDDDGRNDWHEITGGGPIPTDPFDPDTDDDGLLDSAEVFGSNPTNPVNADTDGDGLCDGGAGTPWMTGVPLDVRVVVNPVCKSCSTPGLNDCGTSSTRTGSPDGIGDHPNRYGFGEDQNGNGAWDSGETDPNQYDTDGDAIADGVERLAFSTSRQYMIPPEDLLGRPILVTYPEANNVNLECGCLDPLNADSDGDGLSDGYEDANHDGNFDFLPSDFDIDTSSVETSLPDPEETNPCVADTDGDNLTDWEERFQRQPLAYNPPLPVDNDGDGLIDEDPIDGIDNDGDGLIDEDPAEGPIELTFNPTNPLDWDTDNDWLSDGQEVHWPCVATEYTTLDNDSDGYIDEDPIDGLDNDGDGLIDEDPVDFWVRFVPMLDPTNRDSDSDGFIDGLDEDPCNSEMIPLIELAVLEPVDSDGDGFSDDDEIAAGTHPNDPENHPAAYGTVDVDFDECIDDRIWLEPGACCGEAGWVVVDLDNNVLIDLRIAITSKSVKHGDFDKDGYEDDVRYTVEYVLSDYRAVQLRGIATIDDYNSDLVIDRVVVERK